MQKVERTIGMNFRFTLEEQQKRAASRTGKGPIWRRKLDRRLLDPDSGTNGSRGARRQERSNACVPSRQELHSHLFSSS